MQQLTCWFGDPRLDDFPYDAVVEEFHRTGKHFVSCDLLTSLAKARELVRESEGSATLKRFLDTALDKYDELYDYPSYTALGVLDMPGPESGQESDLPTRERRDRMAVLLLADAISFELAAVDGRTVLLPEARPEPELVTKRFRLAVRVARPALARLGLDGPLTATEPVASARQLVELAQEMATEAEALKLRLSMLPVYVSHDEYLFIRVLQTFEATFSTVALRLRSTIAAADRADPVGAAAHLGSAGAVLAESAPLFSLLATMQVQSFRTFRDFTEGASAIQSRNYKLLESLCRAPDTERLESAAYLSTPPIHQRVRAGQRTLDDAYRSALEDARYGGPERACLAAAMTGFAAALRRWRQTHYRLAVRMLGERSGTGYTEGTPYLSEVRKIPVFRLIDETAGEEAE